MMTVEGGVKLIYREQIPEQQYQHALKTHTSYPPPFNGGSVLCKRGRRMRIVITMSTTNARVYIIQHRA